MAEYTIRENPRARRITVTVRRDGSVWVTKPPRISTPRVEAFVRSCEDWIARAQKKFAKLPHTTRVENPKRQYEKFKRMAHKEIAVRVARINAKYKFDFSKIVVRNQRARWGSCSHSGTLSFNYRLIFLPERLADYLVAHELSHLREMNHSANFWKLVELAVPDYKKRRAELRKLERGLL